MLSVFFCFFFSFFLQIFLLLTYQTNHFTISIHRRHTLPCTLQCLKGCLITVLAHCTLLRIHPIVTVISQFLLNPFQLFLDFFCRKLSVTCGKKCTVCVPLSVEHGRHVKSAVGLIYNLQFVAFFQSKQSRVT